MAHSLSAQKRVRQNEKRRLYNKKIKSRIRSTIKDMQKLITSSPSNLSQDTLRTRLSLSYKIIDQASAKGVIHRNKADRLKSRLACLMNKSVKPGTDK